MLGALAPKLEKKEAEMEEKPKLKKRFEEFCFPDALISNFQYVSFFFLTKKLCHLDLGGLRQPARLPD